MRRRGRTVVVVSPLIALMRDQVHALRERDISCAYLASDHDSSAEVAACRRGDLRLVFISPERLELTVDMFVELHAKHGIGLIAVDEAHWFVVIAESRKLTKQYLQCI